MYRTASSRLRALKARTGCRGLARYASTSAVATKSSGGLFSWLTGEKSSSLPPLDFPLEDIVLPPPLPDYVEPGKTKITTLPNGLRIASETSANPAASIGLYVDSGSIYENPASYGVTHLLERMAFKSTTNRSHLRTVREVEAIGGNVIASASREHMSYTYDALKTYVPQMVELLVDCVRNPAFLDWEVNEQLLKVSAEISEYSKNPHHLLLEAIHSTGYAGAYANGLLASEAALSRLNSTVLEDFVSEHYTAPRIVLAASGVDHDKLLEYAEPLLSDLPKCSRPLEPKPIYSGGDFRRQGDSGMTHFALAFELPGGWIKEKDAMTLTVLQMLMGGGGSFSAGGPGKGMYSRLYLGVLNEYPQIQHFSAFNSIYYHTGLFGIQATTGSDFAPKALDIACRELVNVASPGDVDEVQLNRAKQSTKSAILMNLESRMVASEDIGKQILTYGERKPVEHFLKAVDQVTPKDIATIAERLFSSPLTMACYGDVYHLPSYEAVSSRFDEFKQRLRREN
ncbi:mitochondrial-processing peptidase subunit alpha-like [Salvia miltiorrhiza]|uniref:mitochondrial-processing peptidase subunit alpha-like n=1 Tax=Salvia miltiorrhiza TaxID=226208 RepID=UPI0025ACEC5E|nr:mitochondrial-processing peptidase subunit alpha-like [Salvia miltiorrhiza]